MEVGRKEVEMSLHTNRPNESLPMKCVGVITDLDQNLDDADYEISEAIVTRDRIAMDWEEDGTDFHLIARSNDGGATYQGNYGSPSPHQERTIELTKYVAADKAVLLLGKWYERDSGNEGWTIFELEQADS
jgi:hypothetical protein